jgi:DNA-binding NarL/FixJ family response regulator
LSLLHSSSPHLSAGKRRDDSVSPSKIRIALVDDDPSIHVAMRQIFKNHAADWVLDSYLNGREAVNCITQTPPRVVLMDISMPDITGIECTKRLHASVPNLPIIMFTARDDTENLVSSMMAGACGYVVKPSSPQETVSAVRKVLEGTPALCPRTEKTIVEWLHGMGENVSSWNLSAREQQIMLHICANRSDKNIGHLLHISSNTVHNHLRSVFKKLGVKTREEARKKFISVR